MSVTNGGTSVRQMNHGQNPHSIEEQKCVLGSDNNLNNHPIPTVLRHKYQQLRDPKKYAQMIYLTYSPNKAAEQTMSLIVKTNNQNDTTDVTASDNYAQVQKESQIPGPKYAPPDIHHQVNDVNCKKFNSQLMRALMNKKMRKNCTYSEFLSGKNTKVADPITPPAKKGIPTQ